MKTDISLNFFSYCCRAEKRIVDLNIAKKSSKIKITCRIQENNNKEFIATTYDRYLNHRFAFWLPKCQKSARYHIDRANSIEDPSTDQISGSLSDETGCSGTFFEVTKFA